jgi:hypothetical protein
MLRTRSSLDADRLSDCFVFCGGIRWGKPRLYGKSPRAGCRASLGGQPGAAVPTRALLHQLLNQLGTVSIRENRL